VHICTKLGIRGHLVDVINCAEFFLDRFRVTDFAWVEICLSPQELKIAVNTV